MRTLLWLTLGLSLACGGGAIDPVEVAAVAVEPAPVPAPPPAPGFEPASEPVYVAERPAFPLTVGDRWVWEVTRHVGAGLRLLFIPTEPATTDAIATWELSIDRDTGGGRYAATLTRRASGGLPSKTDLVFWHKGLDLWMESPEGPRLALELSVPPEAVAVEKVPCTVWFLDGLTGTCSPAPGGPLAVPPGPTFLAVSSSGSTAATLAQIFVGISTAGMVIPGDRSASEYANLLEWTQRVTPPTAQRIARWRASPNVESLPGLLSGVGREEAAAMVALSRSEDVGTVAASLLDVLPGIDRVPVLRVALQSHEDPNARLGLLAELAPHLGASPNKARLASILALFGEERQDAARGVLSGEWQLLKAVLVADPPAEGLRAAPGYTPSDPELQVVLEQFDAPNEVLPDLLARTPPERRLALFNSVCEKVTFDDDRYALVAANPDMVTRAAATPTDARALLDTFTFDDERGHTVKLLVAAVGPDKRGALVRVGVEAMDFDDGRLALIDALPAEAKAMSKADRRAVIEAFDFQEEAAEARLR